MRSKKWISYSLVSAMALAGCAVKMPPPTITPVVPAQWNAPLPEAESTTNAVSTSEVLPTQNVDKRRFTVTDTDQEEIALPKDLKAVQAWWDKLHDPLLLDLIASAEQNSPTVASSASTVADAAATLVAAGSTRMPSLDGVFTASRNSKQMITSTPVNTARQYGLQGSMALDIWGEYKVTQDIAQYRLESATASMYQAWINNAADVATLYYSYLSCTQLLNIAKQDMQSRQETSRLVGLLAKSGFQATADADLAGAGVAESSARVMDQEVQCGLIIKNISSLTATPEETLIQKIKNANVDLEHLPVPDIPEVPGQLLAQRPDVLTAELSIKAASLSVGQTEAQRYPKIALSGFIGRSNIHALGLDRAMNVWTIGPLAITMPIFDGGRRRANIAASQARYQQAVLTYQAVIRQAINEVETGLINLDSTKRRLELYRKAMSGYQSSFNANKAKFDTGFGSLLELEDSRRLLFSAQSSRSLLQRDRVVAWISLYKALGGGWMNSAFKAAATSQIKTPITPVKQQVSDNPLIKSSATVQPIALSQTSTKQVAKNYVYPNKFEPEIMLKSKQTISSPLINEIPKTERATITGSKKTVELAPRAKTVTQAVPVPVIYENRFEPAIKRQSMSGNDVSKQKNSQVSKLTSDTSSFNGATAVEPAIDSKPTVVSPNVLESIEPKAAPSRFTITSQSE